MPWSQTVIGALVGVDRRTADRWMNGGEPKPDKCFELADALKVDPRWLATGEGDMDKRPETASSAQEELAVLRRALESISRIAAKPESTEPTPVLFHSADVVRKRTQKTRKA